MRLKAPLTLIYALPSREHPHKAHAELAINHILAAPLMFFSFSVKPIPMNTDSFSDRLKTIVDQGFLVSKELAQKAGAKAQDLGEKGVLKLEITRLEQQIRKSIAKLGEEVYTAFAERNSDVIGAADPAIASILDEIASNKAAIEKKDALLTAKI
jgi:hypothetical protein